MKRLVCFGLSFILAVTATCAARADMIWTDKPVRVDRSTQHYERLPQEVLGVEDGQFIRFPHRITVHDSASFAADGKEYVMHDLSPIARDRLCSDATGRRWPCGRDAAIYVGNLFRGRNVTCQVSDGQGTILLSMCRTSNRKFEQLIVENGFAFPAVQREDLALALAAAKSGKRGVWRDAKCTEADQSC